MTPRFASPGRALATLCLCLVIVTMQTTILNVALPPLARDLAAEDGQLQWIVDSYLVVFAGLLLTGAALADRFGRRGVMVLGLAICGAAAIGAAESPGPETLIAWRAVAGVGAALVMPATLSILVSVYREPAQRTRAIACWSLMNAVGAFIGPIAGGLLLEWASWRACFWITLPMLLVAAVAAYLVVPTSKDPTSVRFDIAGAILSAAALGLLVFAIIEGPTMGWGSPAILAGFAGAAITGSAFVWWELRTASSMIDLRVLAQPQVRGSAVAIVIAFMAMSGAMYLAALTLQFVKNYSPLAAAIAISGPVTVVNLLIVPRTPRLIARFGIRTMVSGGIALIACATLVLATTTVDSAYPVLGVGFALMAMAFSTFVPATTDAIMAVVPPDRSGGASATNQLTRQVGQALGIALGGALTAMGYRSQLAASDLRLAAETSRAVENSINGALTTAMTLPGPAGEALVDRAREAYIHGVRLSLLVAAGLALCGAIYAALAIPGRRTSDATVAGEAVDTPADPVDQI